MDRRVLVALVSAVLASVLVTAPAPAEPLGEWVYSDLFFPLGIDGVSFAEFPRGPRAVTVTPSTTPTASATPSATATQTATLTPVPTPTFQPGGTISGHLTVDGEPAPIGLGAGFGPAIYLRRCAEGTCTNVDRTGVEDKDGTYVFREPPPLLPGDYYQVVWYNENNPPVMLGDDIWLGSWYGPRITEVHGGEQINGGDFEVADLVLTQPTHGTGFRGLPIDFGWLARRQEVGSYRWGICECCQNLAQRSDAWLTESLGRQTAYKLTFYPPNTKVGNEYRYCWFVRIQTADGYGESFHIRMLWFFLGLDALSELGAVWPVDWGLQPAAQPPGPGFWSESW